MNLYESKHFQDGTKPTTPWIFEVEEHGMSQDHPPFLFLRKAL